MIVVFDVDEVLASLIAGVNTYYNRRHGTNFTRADYRTCNWWEVWGCAYEYADKICHEFITGPEGAKIKPIPGSVKGVERLKQDHELVVVTSRKFEYEALTRTWLDRVYGAAAFSQVHLLNQYGEGGPKLKKSDVAKRIGAGLAVEDQVRHAIDYSNAGIACLLLDSPWNVGQALPERAKRVFSWEDLIHEIYKC